MTRLEQFHAELIWKSHSKLKHYKTTLLVFWQIMITNPRPSTFGILTISNMHFLIAAEYEND
jgi:hypothetical protein